ncbi:hypothetical protein [Halomarina oriensis]|uniref:Uncharacterized protein n=1 Tax=Halomarina oriensis TaxID=671145 RepID=A0A6B0GMX3_9EURY|nr:hypothetical protein [Halomarina oriensis]MWG36124.1 hypothetical protein [Halomarina oriensis]
MTLVSVWDVPLLVVSGAVAAFVHRRSLRRERRNAFALLSVLVVALVWANAVVANASSVSYWAVGVPTTNVPTALGVVYLLAYPLWCKAAGEATFVVFGRSAEQGGLLWVFTLVDWTASIPPSWRATNENGREDSETDR